MFKLMFILLTLIPCVGIAQSGVNSGSRIVEDDFYNIDSLRSIYITFYNSDYDKILKEAASNNSKRGLLARVTCNGKILDSTVVRYKGSSTYSKISSQYKKPFNIDLDGVIDGQSLMGYKKIKLSNAWFDPTFIKEVIAAKIYRRYLPAEKANLLKVYVQGNYLGLYVNTEPVNKQFLQAHFNEQNGTLLKCEPSNGLAPNAGLPSLLWVSSDSSRYYATYELKSDNGWKEFVQLVNVLSNSPDSLFTVLNIDRVLWYFAVNAAVMNLDSYNMRNQKNYYLYQTKDGLFQIIPWDLSESFINSFWDDSLELDMCNSDPFFDKELPLTQYLLNDSLYRKIFAAHLRTLAKESLDTAWIRKEISNLQSLAYLAVKADLEKPFSASQFYDNEYHAVIATDGMIVSGVGYTINSAPLYPVIEARKEYLLSHPEIDVIAPIIENLKIINGFITVKIENGSQVELMAYNNSAFQAFEMLDDGENGDLEAEDGVFTVRLPYEKSMKEINFYIRAQNNKALTLLPERAEYEFYIYSKTKGIFESQNH